MVNRNWRPNKDPDYLDYKGTVLQGKTQFMIAGGVAWLIFFAILAYLIHLG
jgi:hypothetical protein